MEKEISLFKIEEDLLSILFEVQENEGELTEELEKKLEISSEQLNDKLISYRKAITYLDGQARLVDEEAKRLKSMKESLEKGRDLLKDRVLHATITFGEQDKPTKAQEKSGLEGTFRITAREAGNIVKFSNRQSVSVECTNDLPLKYINLELPKVNNLELEELIDKAATDPLPLIIKLNEMILDSKKHPDKNRLKEDLNNKEEIENASLLVKHSLTIK